MFEPCKVLGLNVHRVTLDAVVSRIDECVRGRRFCQIVTVNLDFMALARGNAQFAQVINGADLSVPDGVPVLWAARLSGQPLQERVTGVDIVERCAELAAARRYRIFLLGAEPGVAAAAADVLVRRYPGLHIAGVYAPPFGPFTPEENARMVEMVREARPDVLFVAFGAPRQDLWIAEHREALQTPVCVGIGGTFNFLAGRLPRAPRWMQRAGLEWLHRLMQEPARLWRRYLLRDLPLFLRMIGASLIPLAGPRRWLAGADDSAGIG